MRHRPPWRGRAPGFGIPGGCPRRRLRGGLSAALFSPVLDGGRRGLALAAALLTPDFGQLPNLVGSLLYSVKQQADGKKRPKSGRNREDRGLAV